VVHFNTKPFSFLCISFTSLFKLEGNFYRPASPFYFIPPLLVHHHVDTKYRLIKQHLLVTVPFIPLTVINNQYLIIIIIIISKFLTKLELIEQNLAKKRLDGFKFNYLQKSNLSKSSQNQLNT